MNNTEKIQELINDLKEEYEDLGIRKIEFPESHTFAYCDGKQDIILNIIKRLETAVKDV